MCGIVGSFALGPSARLSLRSPSSFAHAPPSGTGPGPHPAAGPGRSPRRFREPWRPGTG
ncbi:hypothetical protein ABZ752_11345 [Streptomyces roseifaciens]